ncbi:MAG: nucleoside 2-deoxyribosyltransferase [Thermodesulfobacteriota bacterium]
MAKSRKPVIYLASPYGFSTRQKEVLLPEIVKELEDTGATVWEPFERNNQKEILSKKGWAYKVARADFKDTRDCDAIFAVVNGTPPDEGVAVELGIAMALGKPTFLFRDDFRRVTDSENYPLNLMLFAGMPEKNWRDYYYTSLEEIKSPKKALVKWIKKQTRAQRKSAG